MLGALFRSTFPLAAAYKLLAHSVVMYNHRTESTRFDCVDLDPYGTAVPFLDAAIGAVADGGM